MKQKEIRVDNLRRVLERCATEDATVEALCRFLSRDEGIIGVSVLFKESRDRYGVAQRCCGKMENLGKEFEGICGTVYFLSHSAVEQKKFISEKLPAGNIDVWVHSYPLCRGDVCFGCLSFVTFDREPQEYLKGVAEAFAEALAKIIINREASRIFDIVLRIFAIIDEAIWVVDKEGNIVECNPAAEYIFGVPRSEIKGKKCFELIHNDSKFTPLCQSLRYSPMNKTDFVLTVRDRVYNITMYKFVDDVFEEEFVVHVARDITKHVQFHMHLTQAERAKMIERVISTISHELNNPLTGIIGFSELLLEIEKDPNKKKMLEYIRDEAIKCSRVVQNLSILSPQSHPQVSTVDLNKLILDILELKESYYKEKGIQVVFEPDYNIPQIQTSSYAVQHTFLNILTNAEDALEETDGDKKIIIKTGVKGKEVFFSVENTGPQIPEYIMDHIFEPFFTTKRDRGGTGIGLSVSKELIEKRGGRIEAENTDIGVRFTVYLPVDRSELAEVDKGLTLAGTRFLVISSEPSFSNMLHMFLTTYGASVFTCSSCEECEKSLIEVFSWVIVDAPFNEKDTVHVVEKLLEKRPSLKGKVIVTTYQFSDPEEYQRLLDMGCKVLFKPFTEEELLAEIE